MNEAKHTVGVLCVGVLVVLAAAGFAVACDESTGDGFGAAEWAAEPWAGTRVPWSDTGVRPLLAAGEPAPLFDSVDEHFNPVSMADMIDGRPLVLTVGSCS